MNRRVYYWVSTMIVIVAVMALLVFVGCSKAPEKKIDSFIRGVVVDKVGDSEGGIIKVVHLPDDLINDTKLFTITLKEDAEKQRPIKVIWPLIDIGSNLAFEYLTETGMPKYKLDNICTMTTGDIVLLDRPGDFDQMTALAQQKQKQKLLEEEREKKELRYLYKPINTVKE